MAVPDVFDALTADRPYRQAMSADQAFAILNEMTGPALDIECVDALKRALVALEATSRRHSRLDVASFVPSLTRVGSLVGKPSAAL